MEVTEVRTWVIFYLLSFVVLLVAICITTQDDGRRWISLMLTLIVVGVNLFLLLSELKRHQARKALIRQISKHGGIRKDLDPSRLRR
jgi:CDP-diglyceride synthetase